MRSKLAVSRSLIHFARATQDFLQPVAPAVLCVVEHLLRSAILRALDCRVPTFRWKSQAQDRGHRGYHSSRFQGGREIPIAVGLGGFDSVYTYIRDQYPFALLVHIAKP